MKRSTILFILFFPVLVRAAPTDGDALRTELRQHYPSLAWVERYREAYPAEAQGDMRLWRGDVVPVMDTPDQIVAAVAALQDQHVALAGPAAGKQETLGLLFRTSSDGAMAVWRQLDPTVTAPRAGDQVLAIDGQPVAQWLARAATSTFGGNRRSRMAEAALKLGAADAADMAGASADGPMLAGFCAVVRKLLTAIDALAARSDVLLVDLRGNLGGFGREARLLARALSPRPLPATFDLVAGGAAALDRAVGQLPEQKLLPPHA